MGILEIVFNSRKFDLNDDVLMGFDNYFDKKSTITCCHILENGEPILYVSHDEDDGMWQFLCGKAHETDEAKLVSLKSVFDLDNSVGILKDMPCGYYAERKAQDDEWSVRKR